MSVIVTQKFATHVAHSESPAPVYSPGFERTAFTRRERKSPNPTVDRLFLRGVVCRALTLFRRRWVTARNGGRQPPPRTYQRCIYGEGRLGVSPYPENIWRSRHFKRVVDNIIVIVVCKYAAGARTTFLEHPLRAKKRSYSPDASSFAQLYIRGPFSPIVTRLSKRYGNNTVRPTYTPQPRIQSVRNNVLEYRFITKTARIHFYNRDGRGGCRTANRAK